MGLYQAGFDVVGIDLKPQKRYPFPFIQADALALPVRLGDFDFIWASPLCQAHTPLKGMWNGRDKRGLSPHIDLIPQTRDLLIASGRPYVIENVVGAPLRRDLMLCGTMFGLGTRNGAQLQRHRIFEASFFMMQPHCDHRGRAVGIYGEYIRDSSTDSRRVLTVAGDSMSGKTRLKREVISIAGKQAQRAVTYNEVRQTYSVIDAREAMEMPWATIAGLSQAIPPAYARYIGAAALNHIDLGMN